MRRCVVILIALAVLSAHGQDLRGWMAPAYGVWDAREALAVPVYTSTVCWLTCNQDPAQFATWGVPDGSQARNIGVQTTAGSRPAWQSGPTNGNGCLLFDGTNHVVLIEDSANLSFGNNAGVDRPFSVALWARGTNWIASDLISKGISTQREWRVIADGGTGAFMFGVYSTVATVRIAVVVASHTADDGAWHHIACTYSGNKSSTGLLVYFDGVAQSTTSDNSGSYNGMPDTTAAINIGGTLNLATLRFRGAIDDVLIEDRVLTATEISRLTAEGRRSHP